MLQINQESFESSNNLNISSSLSEMENSSSKSNDSSHSPVSYSQYFTTNQFYMKENFLSNGCQVGSALLSLPLQTEAQAPSLSHLSTTTTNPSQPKSSISSKSSMTPQTNTASSFKNKFIDLYAKEDINNKEQFFKCNQQNIRNSLSDIEGNLSIYNISKEPFDEREFPAQKERNDTTEIDNLKRTFDDLMKRKSEKELIIKNQIEKNKKNLLEKFFSSNSGSITSSNNSNSNCNCNSIFISGENNDKEKHPYTINEKVNEEVKCCQNENSNGNNYYYLKDKYKEDRKNNKTKSSIFKSEDLRVSKTDTVNLKQNNSNDENEDIMNLYTPINEKENNNDNNNNNIILIQKKLFESQSENDNNENEFEKEINTSIKNNDIGIFEISDIRVKEEKVLLIEKVNNFVIIGVKKKVKKNNERSLRLLSMQLVEKIDYNSSMQNSNMSSGNNKKHNKTENNVLTILNSNRQKKNNKNTLVLGTNKNRYNTLSSSNNNINNNITQSQKMSVIKGNSNSKQKQILNIFSRRNHSNGKNVNSTNNSIKYLNNFPLTTKNKQNSLKLIRASSGKQKEKRSNLTSVIETISTNQKIKYSKPACQIDAISKLKNVITFGNETEKHYLILAERVKDNYIFKGIYELSKNKKYANQFCCSISCPPIITLNLYDIYIEDEKQNFTKMKSNLTKCIQTILVLKKI